MKFYNSRECKNQQAEWYEKLEADGFEDIEGQSERLVQKNIRTISWQNRDLILEIYLELGKFIESYPEMPEIERAVMEAHMRGVYAVDISDELNYQERHVRRIIAKYKAIIRAIQKMNEE